MDGPRPARDGPYLLLLVIQNVTVYWGHYFRGVGFPWDFSMSYYAMVAFWTAAVRQGVFPQWVPFQQMGYPFGLQLQSGMNYLPLWIYPALNIPYTLHAAIVLQCVHVLAGSVGMFTLARQLHESRRYALVAAVAFQFFGGFYSNAEHVDIVRAFAYAPWLLYVFSLDRAATAPLPRRAMLIPPVLYLFLTGAYPGNVIAGGVIIPLFVGLQLLDTCVRGARASGLVPLAARLAGLSLLGCGMAILQLGPVWLFREQFVRAETLVAVPRVGLWLEHLPGLFLSNKTLPGEILDDFHLRVPADSPARQLHTRSSLEAVLGVCESGNHRIADGSRRQVVPGTDGSDRDAGTRAFPVSKQRLSRLRRDPVDSVVDTRVASDRGKQLSGKTMAVRSALCAAWLVGASRVCIRRSGRDVHGNRRRDGIAGDDDRAVAGTGPVDACRAGHGRIPDVDRRRPRASQRRRLA